MRRTLSDLITGGSDQIVANAADGTQHFFPAGTDKSVVDKVMKSYAAQSGASGTIGATLGSFVEDIPIVGPSLVKGAEYTAAGARSLISGKPFGEELGEVKQKFQSAKEAHPVASAVGGIGGAVAGTGAAIEAAPFAMGASGSLPAQIGMGAASGGAISATDAAIRGQNPVTAGAIGVAGGAAGPVVGKIGSALAEPIATAYRAAKEPGLEAARRVAASIWKDVEQRKGQAVQRPEQGLRSSEYAKASKEGQPVVAMDVGGETTRALAKSAANTSPEARAMLKEATNQRYEQQAARFNDYVMSNFHFPDATKQQAAIDQIEQTVNRRNYEEAFQRGSYDLFRTSAKLQQLAQSDTIRAAIGVATKAENDERILSSMGMVGTVGKPVQTSGVMDLRFWDRVHKALKTPASQAGSYEAGLKNRYDRELKAELDRLVPAYKEARAGAAKFFGAENALEAGQKAMTSKMKNEQMRVALAKMSPLERQLFQDGYIDRLRQTVREYGYRQNVANKLIFSDAAKERLELVVGRDKANELENFVRVERVMDFARSAVQGGSPTAQYLSEIGLASGAAAGTEAYELWNGNKWNDPTALWVGALTGLATRTRTAATARINNAVAVQIAKLLTSNDLNQIKRAITLISNNATLSQRVAHLDSAIGRMVTSGVVDPAVRRSMEPSPPPQQQQPEPVYGGPQQ